MPGVKRDRIVTIGEEETVAAFPFRILRPVAHRAEVRNREHIGDVERLADVALPLHLAHQQGVSADPIGALSERHRI
jgi:hypothetical protein